MRRQQSCTIWCASKTFSYHHVILAAGIPVLDVGLSCAAPCKQVCEFVLPCLLAISR